MGLKTILQRAGISLLLLATATRAAPQRRQTTRTDLAVYESCDADMVSRFDSYLPDQNLMAWNAASALRFLEQNLHEEDLSRTISLGFGKVDLSTLKDLVVRFFGKDAIPTLGVGTKVDSNGTIAKSTELDDQARLENLRDIGDVFARVHKILSNKPTIVCLDASCEQEHPEWVAFTDLACEFDEPGTKTCPYPQGIPYINVCPPNVLKADARSVEPISSVLLNPPWDNLGDVSSALWPEIESSNMFIHEFTHTQILGSQNQTLIADHQPLIDGKDLCYPYGLGATQLMAEADSYLAMRNAENYGLFASTLAASSVGFKLPTKESFIMEYRSRAPPSFGACTPINEPASELRTKIFTRLRSLKPESSNQTYGELWWPMTALFDDFPSELRTMIDFRLFSLKPGSWNQTYREVLPKIERFFQDFQ